MDNQLPNQVPQPPTPARSTDSQSAVPDSSQQSNFSTSSPPSNQVPGNETPRPSWMEQNTKWLLIAGGVVALVLIVVGGVFAYQQYFSGQITSLDSSSLAPADLQEQLATNDESSLSSSLNSSEVDPTVDWQIYSNDKYNLSFKYPSAFTLEENPVSTGIQLIFNKNKPSSFNIMARRDYLPANVTYFLDTESTGQTTIANQVWRTYYLPTGYGDGPEPANSPIYAVQTEVGGVLYSVSFLGQDSINPTQEQILSTFEFIDGEQKTETEKIEQKVIDLINSEGKAEVGIYLKKPTNFDSLSEEEKVAVIARLQDKVLSQLQPSDFELKNKLTNVSGMYGTLYLSGMDILEANDDVVQVYTNKKGSYN